MNLLVLEQQSPDFGVAFCHGSAVEICLVVIEALTGVGADDFQVRDCGQKHLQVADLDFDVGCRQNGDVGRCYPVKEQFSVVRQQSVLGKGLDAQ